MTKTRGPQCSIHKLGSQIHIRYLNHSQPASGRAPDTSDGAPSIAVVMCTYNGEKFVRTQLETILGQTLPPAEIIISDDGSTDRTLTVIAEVAERSPIPIQIHRNEQRLGFSENFLQACGHARTRYIALSDQDDKWAPNKLALQHEALRIGRAALSVHAVRNIGVNGSAIDNKRPKPTSTQVLSPLRSNPFGNYYGFTMLFDRELLDLIPANIRGMDPYTRGAILSHDRWIYFLAATFGRIVVLRECLAGYRQHDGQLYGGLKPRSLRERISTKLAEGRTQSHYLAELAAHRATLLASPGFGGNEAQWAAGARHWTSVKSHLLNRARLYDDDPTLLERLGLLLKNLRCGTYRSFKNGGLGTKCLAQDATITVMKVLRAEGWSGSADPTGPSTAGSRGKERQTEQIR